MKPPRQRDRDLILADADDELVIYDKSRDRAHHLNPVAALVWRHCDGETTVAELTALLQERFGPSVDVSSTWLALRQLGRAGLLAEPLTVPEPYRRLSRRDALKGVATAGALVVGGAAAVSVVTSMTAPTPAYAASCATSTQSCAILPCCVGLTCLPVTFICV